MTVVMTGGLIFSSGFQIAGVVGWLVKSMIIGWVCCWFRSVHMDVLIQWWSLAGCWVSILLLGFDLHVL